MTRRKLVLFMALGLVAATYGVGPARAQGPATQTYNPATVETLEGTVEEVKFVSMGPRGMGGGVHLLVTSGNQSLEVHLGPRFYLEENDFEVEPGDTVEITSSRLSGGDRPVWLAREIKRGDAQLTLREENGTPLWAGDSAPRRSPSRGRAMRGGCGCHGCAGGCGHHQRCCW